MLYLIGLGLNTKGISKEGLLILEKCHKVYIEGYTVDFPYDLEELN
jgi:diphthamide biosynthesis methyltransferase